MNGTEICNYADDTTLYSCDYEVRNVITRLEQDANRLTAWFPENYMKLNEDKCHFILFGASNERANIHFGESQIEESGEEKLLGIIIIIIIIDLFKVGNIQNSYKTRANSGLLSKKVKFVRRKKEIK